MPNDLTKRNLLESRQKLTSSGFTASIWTLSGVVLVACGSVEDFLGIDNGGGGGGGGGRSLYVQKSPVQGARLYFDMNNDGVIDTSANGEDRMLQDAQHPGGFVSDETGRIGNIPAELYGKAFVAVLDGAVDADNPEVPLSGELRSIPDADGQHTLASPITDFLANQADTVADVIARILPTGEDEDEFLAQILNPNSYLDGGSSVEALANAIDSQTTESEAQMLIMDLYVEDPNDTLEIQNTDTDPTTPIVELAGVMISPHNVYVATIEAVSSAGVARYSFVAPDGNGGYTPISSDVFAINARGVISVIEGATPTTTTLYVAVTNGAETEYASVVVTVADSASVPTLEATGATSATIAENVAGAEDLITGISASAASKWVIREATGLADKFDVVADGSNFKLVLKNGESLDFEAIRGGDDTINLQIWAENNAGVRSNALDLSVTVTDANDAPVFLPATEANGLTDDGDTVEVVENAATGTEVARVRAADADSSGANSVVNYAITAGTGMGLFDIDDNGMISVASGTTLDYESGTTSYTLTITASNGASPQTNTMTLTISLTDTNDETPKVTAPDGTIRTTAGNAADTNTGYSITITDADATADSMGILTVTPNDDRFRFERDGMTDTWNLILLADQAISAGTISLGYTATDGVNPTSGTIMLDATDSSVSFDIVPSYNSATHPLVDGAVTATNAVVIPMTAISATGGTGKIEYSIEDASGVFTINPNNGALLVSENRPAMWDYETTSSYVIWIVATDVADGATAGTGDTDRHRVVITVQDANDAPVVEGVQVTANDPLAMAGTPTLAGATTGDDTALTGTADAEYIYGDAGADTITGGGGADHIIGGVGTDGITLSSDANNVETIYYRFSSAGSFPAERDGTDTINGFRRGEDRLVLIDTDSESTLDLDTLLSDAQNAAINVGTFAVNPLFDVATTEATVNLIGMEIQFDDASIIIKYDSGSYVTVRSGGSWQDAAVPYLGALDNGAPVGLGTSGGLLDNTLLPNYFGDTGNTNLQITGDDITANLGIDVLISEKRSFEDGFFATVSATDPDDETSPNGQITRYDITGGTGMGLFAVDFNGRISVSDGVNVEGGSTTLDYDTTSEYTLEITATDGGGAVSDPTTITIGLIENGEAEYSVSESGTMLTAMLDTADPDGVDDTVAVTYQWYTTDDGGTTKDTIATTGMNSISDTTSETLDTTGHTLTTGHAYGVTITYTDGVGIVETVDAVQLLPSVTLDDISRTSSSDTTLPSSASLHTLAPTVVGGGAVTYALSGGDSSLFTVFQGKIFPASTLTLTKTTYSFTITATEDAGNTSDTATFTLTTGYSEASPAIIPDRQAFAHQDPYDDQNDQTNQDNPQPPPDLL